jgi:uncharacterized RDD family membrane protein YckC
MGAWQPRGFADQLNIDTPEQVELEFAVAGIGSRFVAVLLDHLIQVGILVLLAFVSAFLFGAIANRINIMGKWFIAAFIALDFLVIWGYFTLFEAFWNGQTPGKHAMKLRVIKDSGRQVTFFEALSRNLLRFVDYMPALYLVGVITMLCTKRNQRLGDLAAGTIVVHERAEEQPLLIGRGATILPVSEAQAFDTVSAAQSAGALPADAVAKLGPDDLLLIETFFARALDLSLATRMEIAGKIATQMAVKMSGDANAAPPPGNPERFLESIAYAMRSAARSAGRAGRYRVPLNS